MTFVDTGAWAAFFVRQDPFHEPAHRWMQEDRGPFVTSDYILDEVLTLLKNRFSTEMAVAAGEALWSERFSRVVFLTPGDIQEAWRIFRTHSDKGWSFTDCTSNSLMKRLRISRAFSFDQHFSQMRGIQRVP